MTEKIILENIARLLNIIGTPGVCRACGAPIWWVTNPKTGKHMPITAQALNHFADCKFADAFRQIRKKG